MRRRSLRSTANTSADLECSELVSLNAVSLAERPEDGWYLISPTGSFPEPNGGYTQIFGVAQARDVVSTFNSRSGRFARHIKNLWHGAGFTSAIPIFEGHSDRDPNRWPTMNRLGDITDLRADADGLWGMVTWNAANLAKRTTELGALKPSPVYWHEAKNAAGEVFPAMLESVGLVRFPNIKSAPAWTQNAIPLAGLPDAENHNTDTHMDRKKLCDLLGLDHASTDEQIAAAIGGIKTTANSQAEALTTANAAKATLETQLTTANSQVTALTTARDTLTTANTALTTEVATLRTGLLDLAEKKGAITPAERPDFQTRISTANTAPAAIAELQTRKAMNTDRVEINGNRLDLSTANSRSAALDAAISKRMKDDGVDRDTAFARVQADPNFAPLFGAMQDPTRKAA